MEGSMTSSMDTTDDYDQANHLASDFDRLQNFVVVSLREYSEKYILQSTVTGCTPEDGTRMYETIQSIIHNVLSFARIQTYQKSCGGRLRESPWETRKVLMNIWKYSRNSDLLNFRLVNRQWYRLITNELIERNATHTRLYFCEKTSSYLVNSPESETHLDTLNEIIKNSRKFPCTDVRIHGGKLDEPDLQTFLNLLGGKVKSLLLRQPQTAMYFPALFNKTPNVESLKLRDFGPSNQLCTYIESADTYSFFPRDLAWIQLPVLKNLALEHLDKIPGNFELLGAIVHSSNHLTNISLNQMKFLDCLSGYAQVIRNVTFNNYQDVQFCVRFSQLDPKLYKFTIDVSEFRNKVRLVSQVAGSIDMVLLSSKDVLQELTFIRCGLLPLHFPTMSVLDTLNIEDDGNDFCERVFPIGLLSYAFPSLKTVSMGVEIRHAELPLLFPEDDFKNNEVQEFRTVQTLIFHNQSECESISDILFLKFPNVRQVKIRAGNLSKSDQLLWCMPDTVEEIEFSNESFEIQANGEFVSLDSLLTGMTIQKCKELEGSSGIINVDFDTFRIEPWVGSLKNLKHLKINFTGSLVLAHKLLTLVSFLYGFVHLPQLRVTFVYDFRMKGADCFRSLYCHMLPYVNLEDQRCDMGLS